MRAINADALKELFERYLAAPHVNIRHSSLSYGIKMGVEGCISYLNNAPTLDVKPVVHGRWIDNGIQGSMLSGCSVCGFTCGAYTFNYCPNCGAIMDLED